MRIIQSFWSCQSQNLTKHSFGWYSPEYHLMSWALSVLQLRNFYNEVELYTDHTGYEFLIKKLGLPYTDTHIVLDELNSFHKELWALPKVKVYGIQTKEFLHVDGDVFIWKPFPEDFLTKPIVTQNIEKGTPYYGKILAVLHDRLSYFPSAISANRKKTDDVFAYNAGIFGGSDTDFIKLYSNEAIRFIENNLNNFNQITVSDFNVVFEQYLFYCLIQEHQKAVDCLFNETVYDLSYKGFADFSEVPFNRWYLHLLGFYKKNLQVCDQMAAYMRLHYPEYYYRILLLFDNTEDGLMRRYYWLNEFENVNSLINMHHRLADEFKLDSEFFKDDAKVRTFVNEKNICFRHQLLNQTTKLSDEFVNDFDFFERELWRIVNEEFSQISYKSLWSRDIISAGYTEYIFENERTTLDKVIVADKNTRQISCKFNWLQLLLEEGIINFQSSEQNPEGFQMLVIPECDETGYSLDTLDNLDCLLLSALSRPLKIQDLLNELETFFEEEDLKESRTEFRQLVFGRIKKAILNKSVRVVKTK